MAESSSSKIKKHFRKHRTKYLVGLGVMAGAAVGGGVMYVIMKGRMNDVVEEGAQNVAKLERLVNLENSVVNGDINVISNITQLVRRGHPGFRIRCIETGEEFASIRRAAELLDISRTALREHLNGIRPDVKGLTFENLGEMISDEVA